MSLRPGFFAEMGLAISPACPGIHYVHYGNCPVSGLQGAGITDIGQHAQVLKSVCLSLPSVLLPFPLETGSHSIVLTGLEFAGRAGWYPTCSVPPASAGSTSVCHQSWPVGFLAENVFLSA